MRKSLLLYEHEPDYDRINPTFMEDLRINTVLDAFMENAGDREYLREYFTQKPRRLSDVRYRLAVMADMENPALYEELERFVKRYGLYRRYLSYAEAVTEPDMVAKYRLDAADAYITGVLDLERALSAANGMSAAFCSFHAELSAYTRSDAFILFTRDTEKCMSAVASVGYVLDVNPAAKSVVIGEDNGAEDYIAGMEAVFARYGCGAFKSPVDAFPDIRMGQLETNLLAVLRHKQPGVFTSVRAFGHKHSEFNSPLVALFERELQFYISFRVFTAQMENRGFYFFAPTLTGNGALSLTAGYDLSLALKGMPDAVVGNDFYLHKDETHCILTGPNQGGKTTFARMLGQCLYLAHIGLPVPGRLFTFPFFNGLYTHFTKPEVSGSNMGRLKEELMRLKVLLDEAPADGFVIINELFSSAASQDARDMGNRLLTRLARAGCRCLYVTHIFELAKDGEGRVSLTACMDETARRRTYKIERRAADGLVFANHLMDKYHLYRDEMGERLDDRFAVIPAR